MITGSREISGEVSVAENEAGLLGSGWRSPHIRGGTEGKEEQKCNSQGRWSSEDKDGTPSFSLKLVTPGRAARGTGLGVRGWGTG